ncbi:uncharacterized protein N7483_001444 [Penicillium malachiteum]|uniref:uncharacterized protein n=1 Tax=Penicillium malachiteum TaxID=1324776 RepID=UPI002546C7EA|nr:uncharacterized protein N7483_001444 [Penicillium malachiteum]KAJ5736319.1 hypothetical protein N7483_001444 [Penicillium malachiteum]
MSATRFMTLAKSRVATTPSTIAVRSISSTARLNKGPVDATKDTLKKADRVVSDVAVKGINKGEQAAGKIKEVVGGAAEDAKSKAGDVKGNASEYEGKVKGTAEEAAGKAKGKAHEAVGKAKEHLG